MAAEDRARWEQKYEAGVHKETEPDPVVLKALAFAPPRGRALDVACGRGRHAIALARRGYEVDAVDISPLGLASARERAGHLRIRWIEADLDTWKPPEGVYAVVVCVDFSDERLVPRLLSALAPGGVLAYAGRHRGKRAHGPQPGDAARWFRSLVTLRSRDDARRVDFVGLARRA
ncbi:MAG TPA: class I SAM-dependent methyltransferase [Planctomycetota bacterium]|nr:class I SAM-dependent methyltransferase [Planctomycetota bacterium]